MKPKLYGLDSSLLPDARPTDGFVIDVVRADDYLAAEMERDALQQQVNALAVEGAMMRQIIDSVSDPDNEPHYHDEGMGCGLEDRNITDRYEAMRHGWDEAMERVYGEVIPCAEELDFKATDAAIRELQAQGVESLKQHPAIILCSLTHVCDEVAATIRNGEQGGDHA